MSASKHPNETVRDDLSRVELPPGGDSIREYVRVPRRPVIELVRETATGKYRSIVLDQIDAQELLKALEGNS